MNEQHGQATSTTALPTGRGESMIDSGYRDLTGRIRSLLSASPISDVRHIQVEQNGAQVVLHGRVRTYYAKQMAQETVRRLSTNLHIVNSVAVD